MSSEPTVNRDVVPATDGPVGQRAASNGALALPGDDMRGLLFTNIPPNRTNLALLIKASQDADHRALHAIGKTIDLVYVHLAVVPRTDDATGEVSPGTRLALVDANGTVYVTSSNVAARTINDLRRFVGDGPWQPPIRCRFAARKGRSHEYLILEVLPDAPVDPKKGK